MLIFLAPHCRAAKRKGKEKEKEKER